MSDIVHHQSPTSAPLLFLPPAACDFEGVGSGVTAFQTTVSDAIIEGMTFERLVMTKRITRASKLLRSRTAASLRRGFRKSRKVRLLVVIVSVELDRAVAVADQPEGRRFPSVFLSFSTLDIEAGKGCPSTGEQW